VVALGIGGWQPLREVPAARQLNPVSVGLREGSAR